MTSSDDQRINALTEFVAWCRKHINGDEKGEAQIFFEHLFRAFGHAGLKEAGADCEPRIKKDDGGTAFADLVWKPVVLIEMKKRGTDLSKHYRQAFDYWTRLVPNRPRYAILCNFDEFWVYDFETQMDNPIDKLNIADLPNRWGPLAFLFFKPEKPVFDPNHNHERVTREAADLLALLFNKLVGRGVDAGESQRFVLQCLMCLFSQDIGLLDKYFFKRLLEDCTTTEKTFDLIGGLFVAMNTPGKTPGGRFKGVDYFNGGLFAKPVCIELKDDELNLLRNAAHSNWSKVRPEIFGTLFEHSLGAEKRHALGAHFTSAVDIMKIVGPTIVEPWREQVESAKTLKRLEELLSRLERFRVLDPACGSGNFLYVAYRELKRIEARIYERIGEFSSRNAAQRSFGFVTANNFYGIDIQPFAVELAKVTMMLAHKLAIDELHVNENALPLDNLDSNFVVGDALLSADGTRMRWPAADVIIGNPPFLSSKRLKPERGSAYVNALRRIYAEIPGMADYCVYWFRRANDHLSECMEGDPMAGRAGLVGTQNVRNNASRKGGLDVICSSGTIIEAVDNQPWSGEANVHVSIANWVKTKDESLLPNNRRLWLTVKQTSPKVKNINAAICAKEYELGFRSVKTINSSLSDETDVSGAQFLACNKTPKRCFQGKIPGYEGFLIDRKLFELYEVDSGDVLKPYLTGRELLDDFSITRWAIDFENRDMLQAMKYKSAFAHCKTYVLPSVNASVERERKNNSDMVKPREEHLERWWQLWNRRDELTTVLSGIKRYIGCSRVTRRPIMSFISSAVCPSDLVQVFAFDDDYSFGILQSGIHFELFRKSSRLKFETDTRYSVREVFDKFPWPQNPTVSQINAVVSAGKNIRHIRATAFKQHGVGGLRELYRALDMPGKHPLRDAHAVLDKSVLAVYGFSQKEELLSQLLELNRDVFASVTARNKVTSPGIPEYYPDHSSLITQDCLG